MMRVSLVCDGSSDRALLYPIRWLIDNHLSALSRSNDVIYEYTLQYADLRYHTGNPRTLEERIRACQEMYPAELMLVHRDAEREAPTTRRAEILAAYTAAASTAPLPSHICVIPVRMLESWLLFDAPAIRSAANNPNGEVKLNLPGIRRMERLPDPKTDLQTLLVTASELNQRRRATFDFPRARQRVAELVQDYSPLLALPAFQSLSNEINLALTALTEAT